MTENDTGNRLPPAMVFAGEPDARDSTISSLEEKVEHERNLRHEERFGWALVSLILFDAYVFSNMENWAGAVVIGILQLIGVVILADHCKVDAVAPLIDKLAGFWKAKAGE